MRLQCGVRNLASYAGSDIRLAVLCCPALIRAAPGADVQDKSVTLLEPRGGEMG